MPFYQSNFLRIVETGNVIRLSVFLSLGGGMECCKMQAVRLPREEAIWVDHYLVEQHGNPSSCGTF